MLYRTTPPTLTEIRTAYTEQFPDARPRHYQFAAFVSASPLLAFELSRLHAEHDFAIYAAALPLTVKTGVRDEWAALVFDREAFAFEPGEPETLEPAEVADALDCLDQRARAIRFAWLFEFPVRSPDRLADRSAYVFSYTRAEAIGDGVLIDAEGVARTAGFPVPVAITVGALADLRAGKPRDEKDRGGLEILAALAGAREAIEAAGGVDLGERLPFEVGAVSLVVAVHRGDQLEIVATIMLATED